MMISWIKNNFKIIIVLICLLISSIKVIDIYKNYQNDIAENYIKTNGEITFVSRTGTGLYTRALLTVKYNYNNVVYTGRIKRGYKRDGYYKKGDIIKINLNKNNGEIK